MYYVVQANDTLGNIAYKFGTTVQAIMMANGLNNPNMIYVGQRLLIPAQHQQQGIPYPGGYPGSGGHPGSGSYPGGYPGYNQQQQQHLHNRVSNVENWLQQLEGRISRLEQGR